MVQYNFVIVMVSFNSELRVKKMFGKRKTKRVKLTEKRNNWWRSASEGWKCQKNVLYAWKTSNLTHVLFFNVLFLKRRRKKKKKRRNDSNEDCWEERKKGRRKTNHKRQLLRMIMNKKIDAVESGKDGLNWKMNDRFAWIHLRGEGGGGGRRYEVPSD